VAQAFRRACGLLRNLRLVVARTGPLGLAELVAARAAPNELSYQRTVILRGECAGVAQPQLHARRVTSFEAGLVELYEELGTGEPEIRPLGESGLRAHFEYGDELWLFHVDGQVAHLDWISRGPFALRAFLLPLEANERAVVGTITRPSLRRLGIARAALSHLRHELSHKGVTALVVLVNCSNRRWLAGMLRMGYRPVATVHTVCLANRKFVRVVPASREHADALERRGVRLERWTRTPA
jgi:hypothetical protein